MRNEASLIYMGGVPGSGKTTIGKLISKKLPDIKYISSGEIKRPEAKRRFAQSLSLLDQEKTFQINAWFLNSLEQELTKGLYLIDSHYTYPLPDSSFVRLLPEEYADCIDLFILVETSPENVYNRRIQRGRDRDSVDMDFIKKELTEEKEEVYRVSHKYRKPLEILDNQQEISITLVNFIKILKTIKFFGQKIYKA